MAPWFEARPPQRSLPPRNNAPHPRRIDSFYPPSARFALLLLFTLSLGVSWFSPTPVSAETPASAADIAFFESKVRPLLIERCYECHGDTKQKANLRLDSKAGWMKGGEHGPALIPGQPDSSLLIKAIGRSSPDLQMPPKTPLSPEEIAILTEWVQRGAPDARETPSPTAAAKPSARDFWAYQPLRPTTPPRVQNASWPKTSIDTFVLARLESQKIQPVADADPHMWLRRVTFDLTGLPPTSDEIAAFVNDSSPMARERVVDRLLASRAFGERWARHWLDLVGYADQLGTVNDVPAPYAWRYRDYVIRAYNSDKPFDQFIREQIAGDLLPLADPVLRRDAIIATGFLLLGEIHIVTADKKQLQADIADHQIQKMGATFLGQSLGCSRCHDHKFDPITLDDYYGLAGIFNSSEASYVTERGVWSSLLTAELPETDSEREERERQWGAHLVKVEKLKAERADLTRQVADANRRLTNSSPSASASSAPDAKPVDWKAKKAELESRIASISNRLLHMAYIEPKAEFAYSLRESANPGDGQVLIRGNARAPGRTVPRGFVRAIRSAPWPAIPKDASGRLQLAQWLADPHNPLPPRVTVNRLWQKMFGEGLVRSVDYFGTRGESPSHPELLDWLASEFLRNGGSQKQILREIALSRTYALSSQNQSHAASIDPDNRLLWRMKPRRLDAESLRDAILAISAQLEFTPGGPALALHLPENVGGLDPKDVNPISFRTSIFPESQFRHRTLYLPVVRSRAQPGPAELRNLFDFVPPTEMTGQRPSTSVATQALFLLNSDFMKSHAGKLAAWLLKQPAPDLQSRAQLLYLRTLARPATDAELQQLRAFLNPASESAAAANNPAAAPASQEPSLASWTEYCHALLSSNEFLFRL